MKPEISAIKNTFEKAGISNLKIIENDSILNEDLIRILLKKKKVRTTILVNKILLT